MSFVAAWALVGLGVVPILWLLHRHRRRPEIHELPTLMFLLEEDERVHQPRKRQLDLDTVLAMAAGALLALAAAGPLWETGTPTKRVRVVVASGPRSEADGYAARVEAALAGIRQTGADVEVLRRPEPVLFGGDEASTPDALAGVLRAGPADVRILITDRIPDAPPADLRFVGVGDPAAQNVGIVSASLIGETAFVNVQNWGPAAQEVTIAFAGGTPPSRTARFASNEARAFTFHVPRDAPSLARKGDYAKTWVVAEASVSPGGALAYDDKVPLNRIVLGVDVAPALVSRFGKAIDHGIEAAFPGQIREPRGTPIRIRALDAPGKADLRLGFIGPGVERVVAPPGDVVRSDDFVATLLDPRGIQWVFRKGDETLRQGETLLLGLRADGRTWPIVTRRADDSICLVPDASQGAPRALDAPFWPLLVYSTLVELAHDVGVETAPRGDPDITQLGRSVQPFDPGWVRGASAATPTPALSLRVPLLVLAAAALLTLWALPVFRRRRAAVHGASA